MLPSPSPSPPPISVTLDVDPSEPVSVIVEPDLESLYVTISSSVAISTPFFVTLSDDKSIL